MTAACLCWHVGADWTIDGRAAAPGRCDDLVADRQALQDRLRRRFRTGFV